MKVHGRDFTVKLAKEVSKYFHHFVLLMMAAALFIAALSATPAVLAQRRKNISSATASNKSITVQTEANAIVWLDEVRRGVTDANGKLNLTNIARGRHTLRVRASGFSEQTLTLLPTKRGNIKVALKRTADEAELLFQQAEDARERARDEEARRAAAELYRRGRAKRSRFASAHVGLARLLLDLNDTEGALQQIKEARRDRAAYPEASAVEGRILREAAFTDQAIASFRRAIREAHGLQPEAHTGLARVFEDKGMYEEAAQEFRAAIAQLSDTEPVLYQLLGAAYEKQEKFKEAVAAYEKYLQLAPEGTYASALRSILDQLRQQAAEQQANP